MEMMVCDLGGYIVKDFWLLALFPVDLLLWEKPAAMSGGYSRSALWSGLAKKEPEPSVSTHQPCEGQGSIVLALQLL